MNRPRTRRPLRHAWAGVSVVLLGALLAAAAGGITSAAAANPPAGAATAPTPEQRKEVQKLLNDFRKAKLSVADREKLVNRVLEIGGADAAKRLSEQIARDFKTKRAAYLKRLEKSAADAVRAKWKGKKAIAAEVEALRKTVLDVSRGGGEPTKEAIVSKADPAMAKLKELMSIEPGQVLDSDAALKAAREELLALASWWHQAAERLPQPPAKGAGRRSASSSSSAAAPIPAREKVEEELTAAEELAAYMATPMEKPDRDVLLANLSAAKDLDPAEAEGVLILNLMRVRLGIGALALDTKLCDASRGHSKDMKEKSFFAHESPVPGKKTPWDRAKLAGTTAGAENIYMGSPKGADAIEAWWHSPGHHVNMMAEHRRVGLGRHETHWTQLFGG